MKKKTLLALVFIMALTFLLTANNAFAATEPAAWKTAYQETIAAEQDASAKAANEDTDNQLYYYALYDINKDGIPEMILHFGYSEASEFYNVYTYQQGKVVLLHSWFCGGDYLATYPEGNGILRCHARQRYQTVYLWTVSGNSIAESDPIFREEEVYPYTAPDDIVSGSTYLEEYPVADLLPMLLYESWEKDLYPLSAGGKTDMTISIQYPENDSGFFQKVLNNQIPVIPAKQSTTYNQYWPVPDSKETAFSDFIDYIVAQTFGQDTKVQAEYDVLYSDLNGDGQADAVCSFNIQNNGQYSKEFTIFLCEQSGSVYAYLLYYTPPVTGVDTAGVLYRYNEHNEYAFKVFFDKEHCFIVYVPIENYGGQREGKIIIGYNMVHYGTQMAVPPHYRMFRNYSINEAYGEYGARESYGEKHFTRYADADMLANAKTYEPESLIKGEYAGYQKGTDTAYSFGDDKYVWFIESIVYG